MKDAAKCGYQRIMVLESDVRFRDDFGARFKQLMEKAALVNWSYISLSDGVGTHSEDISRALRIHRLYGYTACIQVWRATGLATDCCTHKCTQWVPRELHVCDGKISW
jgi:hypothetical protein